MTSKNSAQHQPAEAANAANDPANAVNMHRNAYNAAFHELGLRWFWGSDTYRAVLDCDDERDCLRTYLLQHQPHLLRAYDSDFLIDAIQSAKARCYQAMLEQGSRAGAWTDWAEMQQLQVGS
jgi:hypothetical protein